MVGWFGVSWRGPPLVWNSVLSCCLRIGVHVNPNFIRTYSENRAKSSEKLEVFFGGPVSLGRAKGWGRKIFSKFFRGEWRVVCGEFFDEGDEKKEKPRRPTGPRVTTLGHRVAKGSARAVGGLGAGVRLIFVEVSVGLTVGRGSSTQIVDQGRSGRGGSVVAEPWGWT